MKIKHINAREILDSRGRPTVEVDLAIERADGAITLGRASAPSGASVGSREAIELRDLNDNRYFGYGVRTAISNVRNIIAPRLISATNVEGRTFSNALDGICTTAHSDADVSMAQIYLDDILLSIYNELAVGSNAILPVSLAFAKAMAKMHKIPLFIMIRWLLLTIQNRLNIGYEFKEMSRYTRPIKERQANRPGSEIAFPIPMLNLVNGGAHASNSLTQPGNSALPLISKNL